jgi:hypothetical protein
MKEKTIKNVNAILNALIFIGIGLIGGNIATRLLDYPNITITPITSTLECSSKSPILFEIAGETIIVPQRIVDTRSQTILVKMKVSNWRQGYYKLENAPVGAWVVDSGYGNER